MTREEKMQSAEEARLTAITPSKRQLAHQKLEFYAFFHFSINTFTDREWGDGKENPAMFHPTRMNADKWVMAIKQAGMKGAILTCKHHDGFCLWPSKYTKHTIAASPYKNGKGDIVREVASACKRQGIMFGIYLSPWDRNQKCYGEGKAYDDYFMAQLTELLTDYGEIFAVWLDGACGEGANGKKQYYDWNQYYALIRRLQPNACICVCGPDVRWCGNEAGSVRESEWSVVSKRLMDAEKIQKNSQQTDDAIFRNQGIKSTELDLGSREKLRQESELIWYPAEVNTSIRPGWFYHKAEDNQVKTLDELWNIYLGSVGGNATFLLNIPPTTEGVLHPTDVKRLKELGDKIRNEFANDISDKAKKIEDSSTRIRLVWKEKQEISYIVLNESLSKSQRVEKFEIRSKNGEEDWQTCFCGTTIGYQKIVPFGYLSADSVEIFIKESRGCPYISTIKVYSHKL